jgi:hypothetical protein
MWKREEKYRDEAIKAASDIAWQQANPGLYAQLQFEQGMTPDWYSTAGATTSALADPRFAGDPTSAYLVGGGQGAASPHFMDIDDAAAQQAEALRLAETVRDNNMDDGTSRANNAATIAGAMDRQNATPFPVLNEAGVMDLVNTGDAVGGAYRPVPSLTEVQGTNLQNAYEDDPTLAGLPENQLGAMGVNTDNPRRARMYRLDDGTVGRTTDDRTDLVTGAPIPATAKFSDISDTSDTFGGSELAQIRKVIAQRRVAADSVIIQSNQLIKLLSQPGADASVGWLGSAAGFVNGLASQTQAGLREVGIIEPPEVRDARTYAATLADLGIQNAEIASALVDLAYTYAEDRDGDGQKSVDDVKQALLTVGASLGDPEAMKVVVRNAAGRVLARYDSFATQMKQMYGESLGVPDAVFTPLEGVTPGATTPDAPTGDLPVLTPEQVADPKVPSGTRYKTTDGRTGRKP